ncbi:MAG: Crp/Fnr family transcriptional regulator [Peptococcaceae bacterium]
MKYERPEPFELISPCISLLDDSPAAGNIRELEKAGSTFNYQDKQILIRYGESVSGLYLITKGTVSGKILTPQGNEKLVFIMKPFSIFGEAPFYNELESNLEFEIHSGSVLTFFDKNTVTSLTKENFFFTELVMKSIMRKAQILTRQLQDIFYLSPEQRICKSLLHLCLERGIKSGDEYILHITQEEIANIVGLSRVTVARVYNILKKCNILNHQDSAKKRLSININNLRHYNTTLD